ncbi:hypothetical protein D9M68_535090 [compost metagenome]
MGIIKHGILGGFRKKTGSVVGAYWRRLDVIRALPRSSGKAPTPAQADQRLQFGLVTAFLSGISDLIEVGFASTASINTPMNKAVAYHLKNAIGGVSPDFSINMEALKFSSGKLELPLNMIAGAQPATGIHFSWNGNDTEGKYNEASDRLTFLVYNPAKKKFVKVINAVPRSANNYTLQLPADFAGEQVYCYYCLNSVSKKNLKSDSNFLGSLNLPE